MDTKKNNNRWRGPASLYIIQNTINKHIIIKNNHCGVYVLSVTET